MANYKKQYNEMRMTFLEKISRLIQRVCAGCFLAAFLLQSFMLAHDLMNYAVMNIFAVIFWILIFIVIVCAVVRLVEKGKRSTYDTLHRATSKYREQTYILAQQQKAEAEKRMQIWQAKKNREMELERERRP